MTSYDIRDLRKSGKRAEALAAAREHFNANRSDVWFLRAYAWCLYDHIKACSEQFYAKKLNPGAFNTTLDSAFHEFMTFGKDLRDDTCFTMLTNLAIKAHKDWTHFLPFAWWVRTPEFFEDLKKVADETNPTDFEPMKDRFIRAVASATVQHRTYPSFKQEWLDWGISLVDNALAEGSQDVWLSYHKSTLCFDRGQVDDALQLMSKVVRRQQKATWAWGRLSELLEASRPHDALTCLIHATNNVHEEQEVAKIRVRLAQKLKTLNRLEEAATQVKLAIAYRETGGYSITGALKDMSESAWFKAQSDAKTMKPLPDVSTNARRILNSLDKSGLTYKTGWINHQNHNKKICTVRTDPETLHIVQHSHHPQCADWEPGMLVDIGSRPKAKGVHDIRISKERQIPGVCIPITGAYNRVKDKSFGFLEFRKENVFIPPELAAQIDAEHLIKATCLAVQAKDLKKNILSWKAIRWLDPEPNQINPS